VRDAASPYERARAGVVIDCLRPPGRRWWSLVISDRAAAAGPGGRSPEGLAGRRQRPASGAAERRP
jgi:hypothetical protein